MAAFLPSDSLKIQSLFLPGSEWSILKNGDFLNRADGLDLKCLLKARGRRLGCQPVTTGRSWHLSKMDLMKEVRSLGICPGREYWGLSHLLFLSLLLSRHRMRKLPILWAPPHAISLQRQAIVDRDSNCQAKEPFPSSSFLLQVFCHSDKMLTYTRRKYAFLSQKGNFSEFLVLL